MCFSPTASFLASAALIPIGIYGARESLRRNKKYLAMAFLPSLFGLQQFFEGFVWLSLIHGNEIQVLVFSYLFLFFAFGFWPFYGPLMVFLVENKGSNARKTVGTLMMLGGIVGMLIYVPLITGTTLFTTEIVNQCIVYETSRPEIQKNIYTALYFVVTVIPFMIATNKKIMFFGFLIIGTIVFTINFYYFAFFSVWCFFAAILSVYTLYIIKSEEVSTQH